MKKGFVLLLVFIFYVSSADCGAAFELRFNTQEFPPYSYLDGPKLAGPGIDIIRAVCEDADINCAFEIMPWARAMDTVERGEAHGLFFLAKTPSRDHWLEFTGPEIRVEYGFFATVDSSLVYETIEDVKSLRVGVYGPSNTSNTLEKIKSDLGGHLDIDMRPDDIAGFLKLSNNRVDAVFSNRDVGESIIHSEGIKNLRYAGTYSTLQYYIALSRRFTPDIAREAFMKSYSKLCHTGEIDEILTRYGMRLSDQK